ncbi:hypothetical protein SISSUDRAFT_1046314 [Sistotremastrum suecicum HHB10207 ss-3]|uniref:Uncharacterized protein n=1 Tax=Sistotremastrum suecicum HHB10207 ss-3 TaxID=1314776 RepID=A0A166DT44_9AGAM|nr:hypothetical protein SISSUDRAFT_1046314 [Sistotremastrum suecicum HHB10207 ss-3]
MALMSIRKEQCLRRRLYGINSPWRCDSDLRETRARNKRAITRGSRKRRKRETLR